MQTWQETSPVSHSQGVAPKQHRDLSQHICGICANWPDCLNNSVYIYKLRDVTFFPVYFSVEFLAHGNESCSAAARHNHCMGKTLYKLS